MFDPLSLLATAMLILPSAILIPLVFTQEGGKRKMVFGLLLAASGLISILSGFLTLLMPEPLTIHFAAGLPWSPVRFRLDALSGFFVLLAGSLVFPTGIYSVGYLKNDIRSLPVFLPLFILSMLGVLIADDAYTFMLFWELMSISSWLLVVFEDMDSGNLRAGFLYLVTAHLAGLLILGSFAVLYRACGSFDFDIMRSAGIAPFWAGTAFLLAGAGFGMKAGIVPLHVWMPEAHPAAPANVSALMSGVMLKVALFGFIRVVWDILGPGTFQWWWGAVVLSAGSGSALFGILMALQQRDLKRLLAYSSVENIGIVFIVLGLSMIFTFYGYPLMAALGFVACLYHAINHTQFKGLLFMGAGALLHSTGGRDMEKMGGLIHKLPLTSALFLVGCVSISALPPFSGFASEWLIFQTALMAPNLENTLIAAVIPFSASILALAGALGAVCFVRVFGIVFLGSPRSDDARNASEVNGWMKTGMAIPAVLSLVLGVIPTLFISLIDNVPRTFLKTTLAKSPDLHGWLWVTPVSGERASYSPVVLLSLLFLLSLIIHLAARQRRVRVRRKAPWSCGFTAMNPRMQYTSTGFVQPLLRIFAGIYKPSEERLIKYGSHPLAVKSVLYKVRVRDMVFEHIYRPLARITERMALWVLSLHQKSLHTDLVYMFITILVLLAWVTLWK